MHENSNKTQRDVAKYHGTPYQYYAIYEKGMSKTPFERAILLAKYYNYKQQKRTFKGRPYFRTAVVYKINHITEEK